MAKDLRGGGNPQARFGVGGGGGLIRRIASPALTRDGGGGGGGVFSVFCNKLAINHKIIHPSPLACCKYRSMRSSNWDLISGPPPSPPNKECTLLYVRKD